MTVQISLPTYEQHTLKAKQHMDWVRHPVSSVCNVHIIRQGCTTSLRPQAENGGVWAPSHQMLGVWGSTVSKCILVYFKLENRIWWQLFQLFISAEKVEMVHFDAFLNMLILLVCLIIENHQNYLTLEWIGIETLEAAIFFKNMHLKHQMGQFFESTVAGHVGHIFPALH